MKILHLTLHKKWFDQILTGTKKTEFREVKPYWTKRLFNPDGKPKKFDAVFFRNGYSKTCRKMKVKCLGIRRRKGKKEYEILLGKIINSSE